MRRVALLTERGNAVMLKYRWELGRCCERKGEPGIDIGKSVCCWGRRLRLDVL